MKFYGGIEAGGTKFICAVGSKPDNLKKLVIPTTSPDETIAGALDFFKKQSLNMPIFAIGIGSFGPVDLDKNSSTYGYITSTPKANWEMTNFIGAIKKSFDVPISFDTDVNAAAFGEHKWGAAQGLSTFIYLTIGTGIGGGGMINGSLMHGLLHPEMGHIMIPRKIGDKKSYSGNCPYHSDCFEGLASGAAIQNRWGKPGENLDPDHPAWSYEAEYISYALVNYILTISPQRIIIGGGVMKQKQLLPAVHTKVKQILNKYIRSSIITEHIEDYIVLPALNDASGVIGAIALAEKAI
ncbi:ROK family protein [Desulforegula conservatrix]|uniref:ROK family protein n=1 Tax=Desulforegula conservatrix TaxID=153026 RepID=UPI0004165867|nr:ROK family protein [Desulforegula conservatrix]